MSLQETLSNFYTFFLNGDEKRLLSLFSDIPLINTPFDGEIKGKGAFANFVTG